MTDYSQAGEQLAIIEQFKDAQPRAGHTFRFIDIGAWHPRTFSNTRALFELGWSGVMIEPSPTPMLNLLAEYGNEPRVTLVQAAVACEPGLIEMHVTDDAVTTSTASVHEQWKDAVAWRGKMMVPVLTLEQIGTRFGHFQFWNIDAEGQSADLFMQMLELELRPACVCVEHDSRTTELLKAATAAGYRAVLCNDTNLVLAR